MTANCVTFLSRERCQTYCVLKVKSAKIFCLGSFKKKCGTHLSCFAGQGKSNKNAELSHRMRDGWQTRFVLPFLTFFRAILARRNICTERRIWQHPTRHFFELRDGQRQGQISLHNCCIVQGGHAWGHRWLQLIRRLTVSCTEVEWPDVERHGTSVKRDVILFGRGLRHRNVCRQTCHNHNTNLNHNYKSDPNLNSNRNIDI